jgi:tetratricopeptide (TPR) repeat protein
VYTLGVILYELLTGTPPLGRENVHCIPLIEVLRAVRETDPPTPAQRLLTSNTLPAIAAARGTEPGRLTREVGGDLEWIVLRCLEKDRSRRYETANALSRDLQRFLANEPVEACPPSVRYRLQKFVTRNKGRVVAAGLILLALVAGVIGTTLGLVRAESERRRAADAEADALAQARTAGEERDRAEKLRGQAVANFHKAQAAVDEYFTLISESKLLDVPGLQPLRKELLDAALRFYRGRVDERADDPEALANLAVTYLRIAEVCHTINRNDEAVAAIDQALSHIDRLVRDFPDARESHCRLAGFWKGWRQRESRSDRPRDPQAAFRTLNRLATAWQEFGRRYPAVVGFRSDQAAIDTHIGDLLTSMGQDRQAIPYLTRARAIQEQLVRDHPDLVECRADLALTCHILALCQGRMGRAADQEATARVALDLREQLAARSPTTPKHRVDLAVSLIQVARCIAQKRPREAEDYLRRAVDLAQGLYREFPGTGLYVEQWAEAGRILATVLDAAGKPAEAERTYRSVAEALERHVAVNPGNRLSKDGLAVFYRRRAEYLAKQPGRLHDAEQLHRQTLAIFEQLGDGSPIGLRYVEQQGHTHRYIGWIQQVAGRPTEAEQSFRRALAIFERLIQDEPQNATHRSLLANTQLHLGYQLKGQHRYAEAEPLVRGQVAYWKQRAGAESAEYAAQLAELALNLLDQGKAAEASEVLRECLAVCAMNQPDAWLTSSVRALLGRARLRQKRYDEAEPLLLAGYVGMKERADTTLPFGEARLPETADRLVELYTDLGKPDEAAKWRAERTRYPLEQAPPPRARR